MPMSAKIRLYVEHPLGVGQSVPVGRAQAHYLFGVMRLRVGDQVLLFDGQNGEWLAEVSEASKRSGLLICLAQTKPLQMPPDLWLVFAPIKKARTDFIVEKATEMGARRILPVITDFTNAARVQRDRLQAHTVEAAEQCGGTYVPEVAEPVKLSSLLREWEASRPILFCDEDMAGEQGAALSRTAPAAPWAILIGPEGGFSETERRRLHDHPAAQAISLGPRILRADTAAVAALTLWQHTLGDW